MGFHPDKHRAASNNRSLTEPGSWTSENSSAHSQEPDLTSVATLEHAAPALDWAGAKHAGLGGGAVAKGRAVAGGAWCSASAVVLAVTSLESAL